MECSVVNLVWSVSRQVVGSLKYGRGVCRGKAFGSCYCPTLGITQRTFIVYEKIRMLPFQSQAMGFFNQLSHNRDNGHVLSRRTSHRTNSAPEIPSDIYGTCDRSTWAFESHLCNLWKAEFDGCADYSVLWWDVWVTVAGNLHRLVGGQGGCEGAVY
jgi:hypothetical protein